MDPLGHHCFANQNGFEAGNTFLQLARLGYATLSSFMINDSCSAVLLIGLVTLVSFPRKMRSIA